MSQCIINTRKAKVKLIYENTFDFSLNDPNECIFESARNEIKLMLQQELEFFLSKLKLKINEHENPFLSNCEKCRVSSNAQTTTNLNEKDQKAKSKKNEFDEIFHMILDPNNNHNTNFNNKKHNQNPKLEKNSNASNMYFNSAMNLNQLNLNTPNSISTNNLTINNIISSNIAFNNNICNKIMNSPNRKRLENPNIFNDNEAQNFLLLNKIMSPERKYIKENPDSPSRTNKGIKSKTNQPNLMPTSLPIQNFQLTIDPPNNLIEDGKDILKETINTEKTCNFLKSPICASHKYSIINTSLIDSPQINQKFKCHENVIDLKALKEDNNDDDLSSIYSNEPNFLKGKSRIEGGSLNSYENLTVLDEAKSDKEDNAYNMSNSNYNNFKKNTFKCYNEERDINKNGKSKQKQKKMKIGCFMDDQTGEQIDLLICDNFKSRYESSIHPTILKNTSQYISLKQLNILEKNKCVNSNNKIYLLYGNIAYSMGAYHKALKFFQTGINTIKEDTNDDPQSVNYVIFKSLLQNNLAKCMINQLSIQDSIAVLKNAISDLEKKLDIYNSCSDNCIDNLPENNKNQLLNNVNKNFIYKLCLLKIIIEFNLAEAYYYLDDFKQSSIILEKIFEELTSENTLKYYESHHSSDLSYDDKEISKFFVKYYMILGKIQYRMDNLEIAMDSFNQSINLRGDEANDHKEDLAQIYNYIALILYKQNYFEKSVKYINKAYNIYWLLYGEDHIKTNMISLNLSYIQKMKGENIKGLEILNKIKENFLKGKNSADKIFSAIYYRAMGTFHFEMENEIKGLSYYTKANNVYKKYFKENLITMNQINTIILNLFGLITI